MPRLECPKCKERLNEIIRIIEIRCRYNEEEDDYLNETGGDDGTEDDEEALDPSVPKEEKTCGSSLKEAYTRRVARRSTEMIMSKSRTLTLFFPEIS